MNSDDKPISDDPFALVDPQLWLITSATENRRSGLIATFVKKASIVPDCPRFVIGLAHQHETCRLIEESGSCVLHLFSREQSNWVEQFGVPSGSQTDKFKSTSTQTIKTGAPVLSDAICAFDCQVERRWEIGDRRNKNAQPGLSSPLFRYVEHGLDGTSSDVIDVARERSAN